MEKLLTSNVRVEGYKNLISVNEIREHYPQRNKASKITLQGREDFINILRGEDKRLVVIMGPCSIHDTQGAIEYANKLCQIKEKYSDKLLIMMRVYFEKPRTAIGWKGLINDPHLNGSHDINEGLKIARKLLLEIALMGVPSATEVLDPIIGAYLCELVSWVAIGARTTESQTHRQMTSGFSAPVGFKNGTDGSLSVAINAMKSAKTPHSFLGIDDDGRASIIHTKGNEYGHIVLRGGNGQSNYGATNVLSVEQLLQKNNFKAKIMIDCSHENSNKDYKKQNLVVKDIMAQKKAGNQSIFGVMLESNLSAGCQALPKDLNQLQYGVSITDQCIGWDETVELIDLMYYSI